MVRIIAYKETDSHHCGVGYPGTGTEGRCGKGWLRCRVGGYFQEWDGEKSIAI